LKADEKATGLTNEERKRALRKRTKEFAGSIVRFFVALDRRRDELAILGKQLVRAATSVAAQYREASRARSPQEFVAKIEACVQESDESQLWLELLRDDCGISKSLIDPLWSEADELISIFITMAKNTKDNQ